MALYLFCVFSVHRSTSANTLLSLLFYVLDIKPSETTAEATHSSTGSYSPSDWVSSSPLRYSEPPKPCLFHCVCTLIIIECKSFHCARTLEKKTPQSLRMSNRHPEIFLLLLDVLFEKCHQLYCCHLERLLSASPAPSSWSLLRVMRLVK